MLGLCFCLFFVAYQYYSPPPIHKPYNTSQQDDTLRIAYIGDSWAYLHQFHDCRISTFLEFRLQRPVVVHTFGVSGLTSKDVYEQLFIEGCLKSFFMKRGYAFSIIAVGVNDTDLKMSITYYQKSMDGIIQFMLANDIHPIILEIPDYNIGNALKIQGKRRIMARKISMLINDIPLDCKSIFRKALTNLINEKGYQHKISVIRYKSWNNNYYMDLKNMYLHDGVHLNARGYEKLDSVIAKEIVRVYNNK